MSQSTLSILEQLLGDYLQSLLEEGVVNDRLCQIVDERHLEESHVTVQLIDMYCQDLEKLLMDMEQSIELPDVDFAQLAAWTKTVHDRSLWIGAKHVRAACAGLIQSCDERNKERCSQTLAWLKSEFTCTQSKLDGVAQMESRIIRQRKKAHK